MKVLINAESLAVYYNVQRFHSAYRDLFLMKLYKDLTRDS